MNVHHLELFYFVAKYRGITPAVRKMPYGIQQPAVSGQILQLERDLGVKLFQRRPFALTPAGEELYSHIGGFFSKLPQLAARLRGEESQHLRLAASAAVLTTHIPGILAGLREEFPELRLTLRDVPPSDIETLLASQEIDVAITLLHQKPAAGIQAVELMRLPIILVAPEGSPVKRFSQVKKAGAEICEPLITLPRHEAINQIFQAELENRGLHWQPKVEVNSLELVQSYAAHGYGLGLAVDIPGRALADGLRRIPLAGFPPLRIGLLHQGKLNPVAGRFAQAVTKHAAALSRLKKATNPPNHRIHQPTNPPMLRALIFDFDGLIVDTETAIYEAWREVYTEHGHDLELATYSACVGSDHGMFDPMRHLDGLLGRTLDWAQLEPRKQARIVELLVEQQPLPGVVDLLTAAAAEGIACAVASSSSLNWVGGWLNKLALDHHFEIVRTRDHVERIKPHPDLFLAAAEGLGVPPGNAIVFEDSENGLRAATAAGIRCVAVPNQITAAGTFDGAALRVGSLAEVELGALRALF